MSERRPGSGVRDPGSAGSGRPGSGKRPKSEGRSSKSEGRSSKSEIRAPGAERLQKILSAAYSSSRGHSEHLILDGRVTVNGETVTELGTKADADHDDIRVDGRRIRTEQRQRYILLNKPRGYVTTRSDPQRRPWVNV